MKIAWTLCILGSLASTGTSPVIAQDMIFTPSEPSESRPRNITAAKVLWVYCVAYSSEKKAGFYSNIFRITKDADAWEQVAAAFERRYVRLAGAAYCTPNVSNRLAFQSRSEVIARDKRGGFEMTMVQWNY